MNLTGLTGDFYWVSFRVVVLIEFYGSFTGFMMLHTTQLMLSSFFFAAVLLVELAVNFHLPVYY